VWKKGAKERGDAVLVSQTKASGDDESRKKSIVETE